MLEDIYGDTATIERLRSGPAGQYIDDFVRWLRGRGYAASTIGAYVPASVDFFVWARRCGLAAEDLGQGALDGYRGHLVASGRWSPGYGKANNYYSGARRIVAFLREVGVVETRVEKEPEALAAFRSWLIRDRGLAENTASGYLRVVGDLVAKLGSNSQQYQAESVRAFVLHKSNHHSTSAAKGVVTAVRNYLRFLVVIGECPAGLDESVPRIAGWRLATLPRYIAPEEVERVINACDMSTRAGVRDRAVLLLLARLALRAGDVAALQLKDIDWKHARLRVSGKARRECWLPLPQGVGDAIFAYLDAARPRVDRNAVFLNNKAPYPAIASHAVSQIARRAILRAGVEAPQRGAHLLRHSAATTLLRRGVPLDTISVLLRHDSIESTAHYAKVDLELLRSIARPWPRRPTC